jgi:GH24 family phage-related lysozyme (muramidase)
MKKIILSLIFSVLTIPSFAYHISNKGIEHIKKHESCSLTAYWDSNGYSIGYGHHSKEVKKGMKISKSKAYYYLKADLKMAEEGANRLIKNLPYTYKFSQSFFDGLVDLVYNCGESGIKNSTFYSRLTKTRVKNNKINKNDYEYCLAAVKNCRIKAKGHIERRKNTYNLMRS